jgi:rod shape-determining protein MreC
MLKREHKVSNISSEAIFAIPAMKPSRVIFASIFCLFLMITDIRYESGSHIRSFSNDMLKPITFLTRFPLQIYENFNLFLSSRVNLEKKLQSLQEENLKLKATNQFMEKISIDNSKLNALWSSLSIDKERFLISKKGFLSSNEYQPLLVLDINSKQIVKKDSAVVSEQGLTGRVSNVGFSSTEVLLVQDIRSSIPVISSDSSLHATLEGKGLGRNGKLKFISKTAEFSAGERVYTSGLGEIFPDGIVVGEVVSVTDPVDSEFLEVEIFFYSDPVNQDYFLIYKNE